MIRQLQSTLLGESILLFRISAPVPVWLYLRTKARHGGIYMTWAPSMESTTSRSRQQPQEMRDAPRLPSMDRPHRIAPRRETPTTPRLPVYGISTSRTHLMVATLGQPRMRLPRCRCNEVVSSVVVVVMLSATSLTFST